MAILIGKGQIFGLAGAALAMPDVSGYISPNLQTLRLSHSAGEVRESKGQDGIVSSKIFPDDDILECTFDFIPEGTTVANAKLSAALPKAGERVHVSGLPVIEIGSFTDALNATTTNPWFYEGGGSINGGNDDKWTMTLPLRRYKGIASATQIT